MKKILAILAVTLSLGLLLEAQISVPNTLVAGNTITAAGLNTNFSTIANHALDRLSGGNLSGNVTADALVTIDGIDIGATVCTTCAPTFKDLTLASPATGLTVGGNVIINTVGKIPALTATYFSALAYDAANLFGVLQASLLSGDIPAAVTQNSEVLLHVGKQTLWIPASAMNPTVTNGATGPATTQLTVLQPNVTTLTFVDVTKTYAEFAVAFPKSWNAGTITYQAYYTSATATSGPSVWGLQCVASGTAGSIDVAYGVTQEVTTSYVTATANLLYLAAESSALTISAAAADKLTTCRVYRDPVNAGDTRAASDLLLGIKLFFTTNAKNDS